MIFILTLQLTVLPIAYGEWQIVYDKLNSKTFSLDEVNSWSFSTMINPPFGSDYCSNCSNWSKTFTCASNEIDLLIINNDCQYIQQTFTSLPPHYKIRIIFAAYFLGEYNSHFKVYLDSNLINDTHYNNLQFNENNCDSNLGDGFDYKIMEFQESHTNTNAEIKFYSTVKKSSSIFSTTYRYLGIRNIQISIQACDKSCLTCSSETSCDSCYSGATIDANTNLCKCLSNNQFLDIVSSQCVEACPRTSLSNNFICYQDNKLHQYLSDFNTNIFNDLGEWLISLKYSVQLYKITLCDTLNYVGPFYSNDLFYRLIMLDDITQQIRVRATFFMSNWSDGNLIQVLINGIISDVIYLESGIIKSQNNIILSQSTNSCGILAKVELILNAIQQELILTFNANMNSLYDENWGVRDILIDQISCSENCDDCDQGFKCKTCSSGYFLHKGLCTQSCPPYSTIDGQDCKDYDEYPINSQYKIQAFYDTSIQGESVIDIMDNFHSTGSSSSYNDNSGSNFGYLLDKRVYGSKFNWYSGYVEKQIIIQEEYYSYTLRFETTLGEGIDTFKYTTSNHGTITLSDSINDVISSNNNDNIWGLNSNEKQYKIQYTQTYDLSPLTIKFEYDNSNINGWTAISNYFLIIHYCTPFCKQCNGSTANECLDWDTADNSKHQIEINGQVFCQDQYVAVFEAQQFMCEKCSNGCRVCVNTNICTKCLTEYYLNNGLCHCYSSYYQSGSNCLPCDQKCGTCLQSDTNCLSCLESSYRHLEFNQCLCNPYYEEDINSGKCLPVCGDMVVVEGEECDDGNLIQFDGCHKCKFSCQLYCNQCIKGTCYSCADGYQLIPQIKQCVPICGDMIKVEQESCDENNSLVNDGCYQCNVNCNQHCSKCTIYGCQQCIKGYILNQVTQKCDSICGDMFVVDDEECDDGNRVPFDGCFNCQYSCQQSCKYCILGQCQYCNSGYQLDFFSQECIPICGDGIKVQEEECDDGNSLEYDGCYQCQFQCSSNCNKCKYDKCEECTEGWVFDLTTKQCSQNSQVGIVFDILNCELANDQTCLQCKTGFYYDNLILQCLPICGDGLIVEHEQCEVLNNFLNDGCEQCQYICPQNCLNCQYGQCNECQIDYVLSYKNLCVASFNHEPSCQVGCQLCVDSNICLQCSTGFENNQGQCLPVCGDLIIQATEECDDGNNQQGDGCYQCQYSCPYHCDLCQFGQCLQCNLGYELFENKCLSICEDGGKDRTTNVVLKENSPQCTKQCSFHCSNCIFGQCIRCKEDLGYYLINEKCESICGDKIIAGQEQCDDGNQVFNDGCNQCQYQCIDNCIQCQNGICSQCEYGFKLDIFAKQCLFVMGDGIITKSEICDSKEIGYFGFCYNNQYQCHEQCSICIQGICLLCNQGWELSNSQCYSICGDGLITYIEQCDDGNPFPYDGCHKCEFQCPENCDTCNKGICQECRTGFQLEQNIQTCSPICGDEVISGNEQCDDGNDNPYDGCDNCRLNCQQECTSCILGICYSCDKPGWQLDSINGSCIEICGDHLIVGIEQCDDGNTIPFDGCYECQLQCQEACTLCQLGVCKECNTIGWILVEPFCKPICGDSLVVGNEECDDGNLIRYDGCFECKFDCQESCELCRYGYCFKCQEGWKFNNYQCDSICGDGIIVGGEQCDDSNDIPNDGCFECKYSCDIHCQECGNGVCLVCQQGWELSESNQCSPFCGDRLIQVGYEDCDDGNDIEFDGCFNCFYSCHQACTNCVEGICLECNSIGWTFNGINCKPLCGDGLVIYPEQCDDQNDITNDGCYNCQFQCHEACEECQEGVCTLCKESWYQFNDQCETICGDGLFVSEQEQCDDGNGIDGDGCSKECLIEENHQCLNNENELSTCFYSFQPVIELILDDNNDISSTILLTFDQKMKIKQDYSQVQNYSSTIKVQLLDEDESAFYYSITTLSQPKSKATSVSFLINVTFLQTVTRPVLQVILEDNLESEYFRSLQQLNGKIVLPDPRLISEQAKENAQQLSEFTQYVMISTGVVSGVSLLTGSTVVFQNMLDQLQFISYIKYVNIVFPENLNIYFQAFKMVSLNPVLKILKIDKFIDLLNDGEDSYICPQNKFADDGINSYFLDNFVSFLFCLICAFITYYISEAGSKILYKLESYNINKYSKLKMKAVLKGRKELKSFTKDFYYSGLIKVFLSNYYDISFSALIQITNLNFQNLNYATNSVAALIVFFVQIYITFKLLNQSAKLIQKSSFMAKDKIESMFDGVTDQSQQFWSLQLNTLLSIKKICFMITIIGLQDNGPIQSVAIALQSSFYLMYLITGQPIGNSYEHIKAVVNEIFTIFNTLTFTIYGFQHNLNIKYDNQLIIGWIHIGAITTQLSSTFLIDLIQQSVKYYQRLKNVNQKQKQGTEIIMFS